MDCSTLPCKWRGKRSDILLNNSLHDNRITSLLLGRFRGIIGQFPNPSAIISWNTPVVPFFDGWRHLLIGGMRIFSLAANLYWGWSRGMLSLIKENIFRMLSWAFFGGCKKMGSGTWSSGTLFTIITINNNPIFHSHPFPTCAAVSHWPSPEDFGDQEPMKISWCLGDTVTPWPGLSTIS